MKILTKFGIVLVVLAMVTSGVSAKNMWWDNDGGDFSWGTALNWNEGEYVDIPEVLEVLGDDPSTTEVVETDFVLVPYQAAIPRYGNDLLPHLNMNVALMNIETSATNVGVAGPIQIDIGTGVAAEAADLYMGWGSFSSDAVTVTVDGGTLTTSKHIYMGHVAGDVVELNLVNGSIDVQGIDRNSHLHIGYGKDDPDDGGKLSAPDSGGVATLNMSAGTTLTLDQDLEVTYFAGTTGTVNMDSATIIVGDDFRVAGNDHQQEGTSVGVVNMNGDSVITVNDVMEIGRYGTGTVNMNDSSSITAKDDIEIGEETSGVGVLNMSGSSSIVEEDTFRVGEDGTGTVNMSGSSSIELTDSDNNIEIGNNASGTGTINMSDDSTFTTRDDVKFGNEGTGNLNISGNASFSVGNGKDMYLARNGGTANVVITGGTLHVADDVRGDNGGGVANITISAGEFIVDDLQLGKHGEGNLNVSGTALLSIDDDLELAQLGGGVGTMVMSGGTINIADSLEMSKANTDDFGTSSLLMSGGTINIGKHMKLAQKGGTASVVMTGGLINISGNLNVPHTEAMEVMAGTTGTIVLGDGADEEIAFGAATIDTAALNMTRAYADGVTAWIDFQPGGLLMIDDDVTEMIQTLIDDGFLVTTYAGLVDGFAAEVGYDYSDTAADHTAVYLVPEPATMLLFGLGGLVLRRKKRVS